MVFPPIYQFWMHGQDFILHSRQEQNKWRITTLNQRSKSVVCKDSSWKIIHTKHASQAKCLCWTFINLLSTTKHMRQKSLILIYHLGYTLCLIFCWNKDIYSLIEKYTNKKSFFIFSFHAVQHFGQLKFMNKACETLIKYITSSKLLSTKDWKSFLMCVNPW